ncbi:PLP-dependent transferase [Dothidotthia symphoricarpi CBS 119687]|uniref:PLP-dependent transferase n=1 Tax=Dothidotthia symphoricarpi CBS 119687 TaxID=1392245 RepID=A0A6A6A2F1_9PLEO|nr:PLP-dependent transferase [Dothidotthia symphoricarpi CBS 119687]KAF2126172.1 PLP-dependent transferase [Dothidotthia symphoricarpi CBS 119687]
MPSLLQFPYDSVTKSLPHPPPLGSPVPAHRHAVSVQLPTWQDMRGMAAQEPRVIMVQQIGYPRSFLNQDVVKVNNACLALLGQAEEKCLIFPALDHAIACQATIHDLSPEVAGSVRIRAVDFQLDESSVTVARDNVPGISQNMHDAAPRRFYLVFFPAQVNASAMGFWRLSGTGISSRLAQSMHEHLDKISAAPVDELSGSNPNLFRELADMQADGMVRTRIVKLIQRASINVASSARFVPSDVFLYPTGMAAIYEANKLLQSWRPTQTVVFGFPYELTLKLVQKYGLGYKFYGFGTEAELDEFEDYLADEWQQHRMVQSVWCECASNPLLRTVNFQRIRRLADTYGFVVVVDETIGSFANVDLAGIADVIVTSLTKSFSGKANVMAGSIVLNPSSPYYTPLKQSLDSTYVNELFGADSRVLEHNSRKFLARSTMMNRNAQHLVSVLSPLAGTLSSTLTHVYYPSTCWSRANYEARMRTATPDFTPGYGGLFTLEFESVVAAATFFDALNVHKGPSLGAHVTLAQPYVQTVFMREKEWAASYGLSESIVRISVGLEDEQALGYEFMRALRLADRFKAGRELNGYLESFL